MIRWTAPQADVARVNVQVTSLESSQKQLFVYHNGEGLFGDTIWGTMSTGVSDLLVSVAAGDFIDLVIGPHSFAQEPFAAQVDLFSITVPEPGMMGTLAFGALVLMWRRRR